MQLKSWKMRGITAVYFCVAVSVTAALGLGCGPAVADTPEASGSSGTIEDDSSGESSGESSGGGSSGGGRPPRDQEVVLVAASPVEQSVPPLASVSMRIQALKAGSPVPNLSLVFVGVRAGVPASLALATTDASGFAENPHVAGSELGEELVEVRATDPGVGAEMVVFSLLVR